MEENEMRNHIWAQQEKQYTFKNTFSVPSIFYQKILAFFNVLVCMVFICSLANYVKSNNKYYLWKQALFHNLMDG